MYAVVTIACSVLFTVGIECAVFYPRFRGDREYFAAVAAVNAATNLTMNLLVSLLGPLMGPLWFLLLIPLEIAVVLIEFFVLRIFDGTKRLFLRVFFANVLSAAIGTPVVYALGLLL